MVSTEILRAAALIARRDSDEVTGSMLAQTLGGFPAWRDNGALLARRLSREEWSKVALAYISIELAVAGETMPGDEWDGIFGQAIDALDPLSDG